MLCVRGFLRVMSETGLQERPRVSTPMRLTAAYSMTRFCLQQQKLHCTPSCLRTSVLCPSSRLSKTQHAAEASEAATS